MNKTDRNIRWGIIGEVDNDGWLAELIDVSKSYHNDNLVMVSEHAIDWLDAQPETRVPGVVELLKVASSQRRTVKVGGIGSPELAHAERALHRVFNALTPEQQTEAQAAFNVLAARAAQQWPESNFNKPPENAARISEVADQGCEPGGAQSAQETIMTTSRAMKKQAQWTLPPTPTTTLTVTPLKTLDEILSHDGACKCNQKTIAFMGKMMTKLGFVYLDCPFDKNHYVFVPRGLDSTNDRERNAALDAYSSFLHMLQDAGLYDNADQIHSCIHEYLDSGLAGKIFFHPNYEEVPFSLLTKKEQKAYLDAEGKECQAIAKATIPTLPKNSFVTLLTDDDDIKGGVTGWVIIRDGIISADLPKNGKGTPEGFLEYLLFRGFFLGKYSQQLLVVKTADNVHYYRFEDKKLTKVGFDTGKKQASQLVKYRGKALADTPFHKLHKDEAMFVIAMLEKNNVLKAA
jgi:hypothetical protein